MKKIFVESEIQKVWIVKSLFSSDVQFWKSVKIGKIYMVKFNVIISSTLKIIGFLLKNGTLQCQKIGGGSDKGVKH